MRRQNFRRTRVSSAGIRLPFDNLLFAKKTTYQTTSIYGFPVQRTLRHYDIQHMTKVRENVIIIMIKIIMIMRGYQKRKTTTDVFSILLNRDIE